jgi:hypothetical protein
MGVARRLGEGATGSTGRGCSLGGAMLEIRLGSSAPCAVDLRRERERRGEGEGGGRRLRGGGGSGIGFGDLLYEANTILVVRLQMSGLK